MESEVDAFISLGKGTGFVVGMEKLVLDATIRY